MSLPQSFSLLTPELHRLAERARAAFVALEPPLGGEGDDASLWARVREAGFLEHLVPESYGGAGGAVSVLALCALREELAYRSAAADSVFAVNGLGSHPVVLGGSEAQRRELLPKVASGEALFAFALTEEEAGSDVGALQTRASREGGGYLLEGKKRFISNAGVATHYTTFARTGVGSRGISAFVVPAGTPGLQVKKMELLGEHPIGEVTFQGCRLDEASRVGAEGEGLRLALGTLDIFRSTVGAAAVGMARRALDEALAYVQSRRQFGAPLAELQGVQFLLAESAAELEASRMLVHRAAAVKDAGQARVTYEAAVAKLFATEAAQRIIDRCLQLHGGNGVVKGFAVERLYRDIRALRIYEGASEVQKVVISRQILESQRRP